MLRAPGRAVQREMGLLEVLENARWQQIWFGYSSGIDCGLRSATPRLALAEQCFSDHRYMLIHWLDGMGLPHSWRIFTVSLYFPPRIS